MAHRLSIRRAGTLLHPFSLPGAGFAGTLGIEARRFLELLADAGLSLWQVLPLGPTHDDGCPYQAFSVHAGNPDLIDLAWLVETYKSLIRDETGEDFPQSPAEQLRLAVLAVFRSWNGERARLYRRREHIPEDLGTAVTVQRMVFGNLGTDSGSGVAFTRDPATGRPGLYGDYLSDAQGEDVVAGIRNTVPLTELERLGPDAYRRLRAHFSEADILELGVAMAVISGLAKLSFVLDLVEKESYCPFAGGDAA